MSTDNNQFFVELFDKSKTYAGLKKFDCGDKVINSYVKDNFKRDGQRDNKIIFALLASASDNGNITEKLMGFVSLHHFSLNTDVLPEDYFGYKAPPLVATVKISMIAVQKEHQRQPERWGQQLLLVALEKAHQIAMVSTDIKGVFLDAKPEVVAFYKRHRFILLQDAPNIDGTYPMILPIEQLRSIMAKLMPNEEQQAS